MIDELRALLGPDRVLTGAETAPWARDWTGQYEGQPLAVARPGSTEEVAGVMRLAARAGCPVTAVSGGTGLVGGGITEGGLILSLDRMRRIGPVNRAARTVEVEAGVVLQDLHAAAEAEGLIFPMTFGAKGSARIGGMIATNAGGSNVLRYGSMRRLVLGLEAVMADGRVLTLMSGLHKDNTGLDLRQLLIGSEGTLGIVTRATLSLAPKPAAYATATVGVPSMEAGLTLLRRLQDASGGQVEAFEFMPDIYIDRHVAHGGTPPFAERHPVVLLVELGATAARDTVPDAEGRVPLDRLLEEELAGAFEAELVSDAVLAASEAQRREMWARREAAAEITFTGEPVVDTDVALPLDRLQEFFDRVRPAVAALDPEATDLAVGHLGDGNIHYTVFPSRSEREHAAALRAAVDDTAAALGGSFSAEHGIGRSKLETLRRLKDPAAQEAMRAVKAALDPAGLLNPGRTIP
ncbi:FAD-binding oxidoreductase [Histidinibacterium aquaticum]|uniref:FAD-binding oxidoreductase n=1 Tax=Histidinibacterium aquaticum TaxID=2613962 RepID=A0A5J5GAV7_9RHOB|nr:FAD-binding oxidoreductase [Histidinibacterium aquaticum]KAA9005245.1 FAD-binding oxidoreductase [Histidinibacterium aquaticum]